MHSPSCSQASPVEQDPPDLGVGAEQFPVAGRHDPGFSHSPASSHVLCARARHDPVEHSALVTQRFDAN